MTYAVIKIDPNLQVRTITGKDGGLIELDSTDNWFKEEELHIIGVGQIQRLVDDLYNKEAT